MKKLWFVIAGVALCGIILIASGFLLGADSGYNILAGGRNLNTANNELPIAKNNIEAITEITVDVLSANIDVVPAEQYGYEILGAERSNIYYRFENGILSIEQDFPWLRLPFLGSYGATIRIFMPRDAQLGLIMLKTASGNITAKNFSAAELFASTRSGNINIHAVKVRSMDIDVTSGNSTLNDCVADNLAVGAASGRFTANGLSVYKIFDADIISGRIAVTGDLRGNTDIKVISGSVTLNLAGKNAEYAKNFSSVSGQIHVNGNKIGDYSESGNTMNTLFVSTTSGGIEVNFTE